MMIALYYVTVNVILPEIAAIFSGLLAPVMTIFIIIAGLVMAFGAVGIHISSNLGSTVVGGIFSAIGYLFRIFIRAIGWIFRQIARIIPRVFSGSRRFFQQLGVNAAFSSILAVMTTLLVVVAII